MLLGLIHEYIPQLNDQLDMFQGSDVTKETHLAPPEMTPDFWKSVPSKATALCLVSIE